MPPWRSDRRDATDEDLPRPRRLHGADPRRRGEASRAAPGALPGGVAGVRLRRAHARPRARPLLDDPAGVGRAGESRELDTDGPLRPRAAPRAPDRPLVAAARPADPVPAIAGGPARDPRDLPSHGGRLGRYVGAAPREAAAPARPTRAPGARTASREGALEERRNAARAGCASGPLPAAGRLPAGRFAASGRFPATRPGRRRRWSGSSRGAAGRASAVPASAPGWTGRRSAAAAVMNRAE